MSLVDFALELAGMPQNEIDDLEKSLPALARLAASFKSIEPELTLAKPHIDALVPLMGKIAPVFQNSWGDIVSVTPTVNELIDFVKSKA
jgi:hypothetical protein